MVFFAPILLFANNVMTVILGGNFNLYTNSEFTVKETDDLAPFARTLMNYNT